MVGVPASGKSTLTKKLGFSYVSSDEIREELFSNVYEQTRNTEVYNRVSRSLENGYTTIADATNLRDFARKRLYEIASNLNSPIIIVIMNVTLNKLKQNNKNRKRSIPDYRIDSMFEHLLKEYEYIHKEADSIGGELVNVFLK